MTMGLQDLMMFRDNLQQPAPTGMDNLRNLQALTIQGMAAEDYMNEPMMNTGLMSLPVAQAGFGGFVKSIAKAVTRPVKAVAKGVSGLAKGVAGAVKNIAKSPIGQLAIPAAAFYFAGPAGLNLGLGGKAALVGGTSGLTSLAAGAKPEDALKRAALSAALTYGGGKLFGSGGAGAPKGPTTADIAFTGDPTGQTYGAVGQAQTAGLGLSGAQVGQTFGDASVFAPGGTAGTVGAGTMGPVDTTSLSYGQTYRQVPMVDNVAAQKAAGVGTTPTGIVDTLKAAGSTALDKTQEALKAGLQFAKDNKALTALGGAALLSGLGAGQQIPQDQLAMAGLTPVETDFDKQQFTYRDRQGNILTRDEALRMIQQASQNVGAGGQKVASGVTYDINRIKSGGPVDPVLSASGGLIGMMYGGQAMPENNMDVKYKEFSGMVGGRGDGMEDNVYMPIVEGESGQQVATLAVSPKEYVVDANTMSLLGNGNPDEGAEIMDKTVKDIRKKATGQTKQQKEIDGLAALNRMRRSV